jgi:hypothetical protein
MSEYSFQRRNAANGRVCSLSEKRGKEGRRDFQINGEFRVPNPATIIMGVHAWSRIVHAVYHTGYSIHVLTTFQGPQQPFSCRRSSLLNFHRRYAKIFNLQSLAKM